VRRELVLAPVPRQERHAYPAHVADRDGRRGLAVRGVDRHLVDGVDERVEPRPPEHPDRSGAQDDPFDDRAGCFDPPDPEPPDPDPPDPDPPDPDPDELDRDDPEPDDPDDDPSDDFDDPEPPPSVDVVEVFFDSEDPDDPPSLLDDLDRLSVL
jgi:hypothetical protein